MTRNAHEDGGSPPQPSAQSGVRAEFCGILTGFDSCQPVDYKVGGLGQGGSEFFDTLTIFTLLR